jgi:hypothetical protein
MEGLTFDVEYGFSGVGESGVGITVSIGHGALFIDGELDYIQH